MSKSGCDSPAQHRGYVTTLKAITRRTSAQLELVLGFAHGSLEFGYIVYSLDQRVELNDFEWKDQTAYSDGWHFDPTINEYVQRQDELRAHWGRRTGNNEFATDAKLKGIMVQQLSRLNVRTGPELIVKVVAKQTSFAFPGAFPDSPFRGIPQWRLRVCKTFARFADVAPGEILS